MSELDSLINPEISHDEFYELILKLSSEERLTHVLEIGSSTGGGSTEAFVRGLEKNPHKPTLYCMEVSKPRFAELRARYLPQQFVKCYNVSSVPASKFPNLEAVRSFYQLTPSGLNQYPLEQVLGWLTQDLEYIARSGVPQNGIEIIKQENAVETFDMVLIDGSEFSGNAELEYVYGARIILLDDINTFKNYQTYLRLVRDPSYELIRENRALRNGYAAFRRRAAAENRPAGGGGGATSAGESSKKPSADGAARTLPVHFFTIVLNGEPFIRYHIDVLSRLGVPWHWHIVEGVAELRHDTGWSVAQGGKVVDTFHANGLSKDGTSAYLDELRSRFPHNVTVYRKPAGQSWDGKLEMVRAPLANIPHTALLWQLDSDELWTAEQIERMHAMMSQQSSRFAAWFWCAYFVGPDRMISTRNCYAQNPQQEWLRVWRYVPGMQWTAHEPPTLTYQHADGKLYNVGHLNPFRHDETEKAGLVFQHFAYATEAQLRFKETYYGYAGALAAWQRLQQERTLPQRLGDFFPWVRDQTSVDTPARCGVRPLAGPINGTWHFGDGAPPVQHSRAYAPESTAERPRIVIDGVFFQLAKTGIARLWSALLAEWSTTDFARQLLVLDRGGTAPKYPGLRYRTVNPYSFDNAERDRAYLQEILDEEQAELLASTYYSSVPRTPSVQMVYDMIPEHFGWDLQGDGQWREKQRAFDCAREFVCISENTKRDLIRFRPSLNAAHVSVYYPGIDTRFFRRADSSALLDFHRRHSIASPYFLMVGTSRGYKNIEMVFDAATRLCTQHGFELLFVGGHIGDYEIRALAKGCAARKLALADEELPVAYSGAVAHIYPSLYEGFGLTVLEAMACGCPVITTPFASIPEAAGEAALYVRSAEELAEAMCEAQKPSVQRRLVKAGDAQVSRYSWASAAARVRAVLERVLGEVQAARPAVKIIETDLPGERLREVHGAPRAADLPSSAGGTLVQPAK